MKKSSFVFAILIAWTYVVTLSAMIPLLSVEKKSSKSTPIIQNLSARSFLTNTWTGAAPVVRKANPIETEFASENLGKIMSVFKFLRNKEEGSSEPLFSDFSGGEWVLAATQKDKRLRAALFATVLSNNSRHCRIITQQRKTNAQLTDFTYAELPLTDLYLMGSHFKINTQTEPSSLSYCGPLEYNIYFEFTDWFEQSEITSDAQQFPYNEPSSSYKVASKPKHVPHKYHSPREQALSYTSFMANNAVKSTSLSATPVSAMPPSLSKNPFYAASFSRFSSIFSKNTHEKNSYS